MTIFLTKMWGFTIPVGPLPFGTVGWRDRARFQLLKDGDLVAVAGTLGSPTDESDRGSLLGLLKPTQQPVFTRDFPVVIRPEHLNEEKQYRWPYALAVSEAWRFPTKPLLEAITARQFGMAAAQGIVALTPEEAAIVQALPIEQVPLLPMTAQANQRVENRPLLARRSSPPPGSKRRGIMYLRNSEAFTYIFRVQCGKTVVDYKIGWAFSIQVRARQFNHAALPELGGIKYVFLMHRLWDTAREAYAMEQNVLRELERFRHSQNHEVVTGIDEHKILSAWRKSGG